MQDDESGGLTNAVLGSIDRVAAAIVAIDSCEMTDRERSELAAEIDRYLSSVGVFLQKAGIKDDANIWAAGNLGAEQ